MRSVRSRFLRVTLALAITGMALHLGHTAFGLGDGTVFGDFADRWGTLPLVGLGALVCLVGALRVTTHRRAWLLMSAGIASFAVGEAIFALTLAGEGSPEASVADVFYLGTYPLVVAAMLLLIRPHLRDVRLWLDGAAAGLTMTAVVIALAFPPIEDAADGSSTDLVGVLIYPIGDVVLLTVVIAAATMTGFSPWLRTSLFGAGLTFVIAADLIYSYEVAAGSYAGGNFVDTLWPAAFLLIGFSAWAPPHRVKAPVPGDWRAFVVGTSFSLIALSVLVVDHYNHVHGVAVWLVGLALAARVVRTGLTYADLKRALNAEQRAAEQRVEAERAERANQAKSQFLSRMSHELRTPLNAVLGFGQLLALRDLEPGAREETDHILKAGHHLLELINETLEISHIESGRLSLTIEPVAVSPLVDEVVGLVTPLSAARKISIEVDHHSLHLHAAADAQRLKQVLLNLLSNAIKFNRHQGHVRIRGAHLPGERVAIAVSDTGHGIAPEDMPRLFSPFERLRATADGVEGSGLGLALSHGLMEALGGSLDAVSDLGSGSTFTLELPAAAPTDTIVPVREPLPSLTAAHEPADRMRRVLCIEDNASNLELIEQIFATLDEVELVCAIDGETGLERAYAERPDLVLLDLNLPGIQGDEVLDRLRADERTRTVPVIVVSADATRAQIDALLARGAFDYITKPIEVTRLLGLLDDALAIAG